MYLFNKEAKSSVKSEILYKYKNQEYWKAESYHLFCKDNTLSFNAAEWNLLQNIY